MPQLLGKFDEFMASGIHPSMPNDRLPLWEDGQNIRFREESVQPIPGQFVLLIKGEAIAATGATELQIGGEPNLFWGSTKSLWKFNPSMSPPDAEDVSRVATGGGADYAGIELATNIQVATRWSMVPYGNFVMAVDGVSTPQLYKDSVGDFEEWRQKIPGDAVLPFTQAEICRTIGPYAVVMNLAGTGFGGTSIAWSDTDVIEDFVDTLDNAASSMFVRKMNSDIVAAEPLGRGLGFYGTNGLWILEFIGAPFYFGQSFLLDGIGAVSKAAIVVVGKIHYGFGPRGIFLTDGNQFSYIDDPSIHDFVYKELNRKQQSQVFGWDDAPQGTVNWTYPKNDGSFATISFNYRNGTWARDDYARSAGTAAAVFDFTVTIDRNGEVYQHAIESFVPSSVGIPLQLTAVATSEFGYGEIGYGQGGYGGKSTEVG